MYRLWRTVKGVFSSVNVQLRQLVEIVGALELGQPYPFLEMYIPHSLTHVYFYPHPFLNVCHLIQSLFLNELVVQYSKQSLSGETFFLLKIRNHPIHIFHVTSPTSYYNNKQITYIFHLIHFSFCTSTFHYISFTIYWGMQNTWRQFYRHNGVLNFQNQLPQPTIVSWSCPCLAKSNNSCIIMLVKLQVSCLMLISLSHKHTQTHTPDAGKKNCKLCTMWLVYMHTTAGIVLWLARSLHLNQYREEGGGEMLEKRHIDKHMHNCIYSWQSPSIPSTSL